MLKRILFVLAVAVSTPSLAEEVVDCKELSRMVTVLSEGGEESALKALKGRISSEVELFYSYLLLNMLEKAKYEISQPKKLAAMFGECEKLNFLARK